MAAMPASPDFRHDGEFIDENGGGAGVRLRKRPPGRPPTQRWARPITRLLMRAVLRK